MKKLTILTCMCIGLFILFSACSNQATEEIDIDSEANEEELSNEEQELNEAEGEPVEELTEEEIDEIVHNADNKLELMISNENGETTDEGHPIFTIENEQISIFYMIINTNPDHTVYIYINDELLSTLEAESVYEDILQIKSNYLIEGTNQIKVEQYVNEETRDEIMNKDMIEFEVISP
ncbi:hypothetical protein [Alkalihalophilus marmarensis]|uniref:hypothetical protein n=1 Tax=Alkalihalophilus marmarensis TaxID=521377 RepID=UPI002E2217A7|nr:hypothetical protein [Alkalihalophilus marmarensis]